MTAWSSQSDTCDFLYPKDGKRGCCSILHLVIADSMDDGGWVANPFLRGDFLLPRLLLKLHIEEPLVDLDAWQARLRHGLPTHLAVPLSTQSVIQRSEVVDLICGLFATIWIANGNVVIRVDTLFSKAFTRDQHVLGRILIHAVLVAGSHWDRKQFLDLVVALIVVGEGISAWDRKQFLDLVVALIVVGEGISAFKIFDVIFERKTGILYTIGRVDQIVTECLAFNWIALLLVAVKMWLFMVLAAVIEIRARQARATSKVLPLRSQEFISVQVFHVHERVINIWVSTLCQLRAKGVYKITTIDRVLLWLNEGRLVDGNFELMVRTLRRWLRRAFSRKIFFEQKI